MIANRALMVLLALTTSAGVLCAQAPAPSLKIAVVNINKVFEEYTERNAEEKVLKDEIDKINGELQKLKVQFDDLLKQAAMHNQGSPKRAELDQQIYEVRANMELYSRLQTIELEERTVDMTKKIYEAIRLAIAGYAQRNGLAMVLRYDEGEVETTDPTELRLHINSRQVLYFKPSIDITQQILQELNQR